MALSLTEGLGLWGWFWGLGRVAGQGLGGGEGLWPAAGSGAVHSQGGRWEAPGQGKLAGVTAHFGDEYVSV